MAIVTRRTTTRTSTAIADISRRLAKADGITTNRPGCWQTRARPWSGSTAACTPAKSSAPSARRDRLRDAEPRTTPRRCASSTTSSSSSCTANPDGNDLVADWYMRRRTRRSASLAGLRVLYQKYIGHDNNRDFFAATWPRRGMNRVMYRSGSRRSSTTITRPGRRARWCSSRRSGIHPTTTSDPLVIIGLERGGRGHARPVARRRKPGVGLRTGPPTRRGSTAGPTTCHFHNTIGLFTETIGGPSPSRVPLIAERADARRYRLPVAGSRRRSGTSASRSIIPSRPTGRCWITLGGAVSDCCRHLRHGQVLDRRREQR